MTPPVIIHGAPGQVIDLPVSHGPATGYGWLLTLPPGVAQVASAPGDRNRPAGDPAGGALRVTAPAGRHRITAKLARAWEPDAPIRTVEIELVIDAP